MGCKTPRCRIEAASSSSSVSEKVRRGWAGFGRMSESENSATAPDGDRPELSGVSSGAARPTPSTSPISADKPFPSRFCFPRAGSGAMPTPVMRVRAEAFQTPGEYMLRCPGTYNHKAKPVCRNSAPRTDAHCAGSQYCRLWCREPSELRQQPGQIDCCGGHTWSEPHLEYPGLGSGQSAPIQPFSKVGSSLRAPGTRIATAPKASPKRSSH
mmetsp:Transcript_2683/g.3355  ORF Transcript_2683/g.3355 Transcript_2683/m.3355 type:complete len:212 (+) Transcript_2683:66-701(+)